MNRYRPFLFLLVLGIFANPLFSNPAEHSEISLKGPISSPQKTEKPIDSGRSHFSALSQTDPNQWDFFADVLYWYTGEIQSVWANVNAAQGSITEASAIEGDIVASNDAKILLFDWDVGCRVGAGYTTGYDLWGIRLFYTGFNTQSEDHYTVKGSEIISSVSTANVSIGALGFLGTEGLVRSETICWQIFFNMFDLELDRQYFVSQDLSFRPYLGVKGGWIHQKIDTELEYFVPVTSKEHFKNNFWGVGPEGGLNSTWNLGNIGKHFFHLFGDFGGAFMWGVWTFGDVFKTSNNAKAVLDLGKRSLGALMLQGLMALGWEVHFESGPHFATRLGYEMQIWFDQFQLFTTHQGRLFNDLTFQGGVLDFHLDF